MMAKISGLTEINANIEKLAKRKLPKASVKALNTIAKNARNKALKSVAKEMGVSVKTIRGRVHTQKAKTKPEVKMRVNRLNMPLIRVLEKPSNKLWEGQGGILVGKYAVKRGFKQRLKNGRVHIMQRAGKARYPIDVVKVPIGKPLTDAFAQALKDYPEQLQAELSRQLISSLRR